jgi:hypothetical protein
MKIILILISILLTSATAGNFKITVSDYEADTNTVETAKKIVNELAPLLDKPLNWCTIEPTGSTRALRKGPTSTKVLMEFTVKCDFSETRKTLKNIWNKYDTFLYAHGNIVDAVMERQYPDYNLVWGRSMSDYYFIQIKLLNHFGGSNSFNNNCLFFRLSINDDFETIPMRVAMPGSLAKIIPTNGISSHPPATNYTFLIDIPNKILDEGELDIKLDRVWHLSVNEQYKTTY